ncbi:MAG: carboxyl transferase domain-containing protein, partial [Dehalococcoidales bacterium]|nr:carboxyl transferase domain-containing protein [Dehalococcoidales bacterium]
RAAPQHKLGRLTARERLEKLFDPGTFEETGVLLNALTPDSDGKITHVNEVSGFGQIHGQLTIAHADDVTSRTPGTRAGTQQPRGTNPKLYPELCNPVVTLYDGGDDTNWMNVVPRWGTGNPLRAVNGLRKVPHVNAIMGNCVGVLAMEAITGDFVVQVKGAKLGTYDPCLLAAPLTGDANPDEMGGWKLHAEETGQVDAFADNDEQCLQIVREFLSYMPRNNREEPKVVPCNDPADRQVEKIMTIIPDKPIRVYDQNQVIKQIVDDGKYLPLRPFFGKALITCLARMNGRVVGIIANQTLYNAGAAGFDECDKAADFIILCDTYNIPLIFLADTPGNLVGKPAEQRRIPTKIMTWMEAMAMSTVPKISIIIRKAYGMAISNMCGTNCGPDIFAAMTTAEISFMSPEAAANVTYLRRIESAPDPAEERARLIAQMQRESSPFPAAQAGLLDDVIDPRDVRKYIIAKLDYLRKCKGDFISETKLQNWPTGF